MSPRVSSSLLANHVGGMRHEERRWGKEARMTKLRIEKRGRASTTSMDPERTIKTGAHTRTTSGTLTEGWEITECRWQHFCHNELVNHNIGLSLCDIEYIISELKNQIFHLLGKVCDKGSGSTGLGPVTSLQNSRKAGSYLPPCPAPCPAWTRPLRRATLWSRTQPTAAAGTCRTHEDETENQNKPWDDPVDRRVHLHPHASSSPKYNRPQESDLSSIPLLLHSEQLSRQTDAQIFLRNVQAVVLPDISVLFVSSFI